MRFALQMRCKCIANGPHVSYDTLFERAALMLGVDVTIRSDDRRTFGVLAQCTLPR